MFKIYTAKIPVRPIPTARARHGQTHAYNSPKYSAYKKAVGNILKAKWADLWVKARDAKDLGTTEPKYFVVFQFKGKGLKGDRDNYAKAIQDAMQDAGLILNDKSIRGGLDLILESPEECIDVMLVACPNVDILGKILIDTILNLRPGQVGKMKEDLEE